MSIQYLAGAEIDYREDIEGAQFVIRNPNAATTCGCGSSFSPDELRLVAAAAAARAPWPAKVPDVIAAVDLGSNSFHMVVARYSHGQLIILDRLREMVRLGAGLDEQGRLTREAIGDGARVPGALRPAPARHEGGERARRRHEYAAARRKRKGAFLDRARAALGHPIEIISGIEEARLIYLGVAHTMPSEPGRRLVVDIGGGSTEIIIGEGVHAQEAGKPVHGLRQHELAHSSATARSPRSA